MSQAAAIDAESAIDAYTHLFHPATEPGRSPLLLLHRTGGSENDLVPLARRIAPGSSILAIRGNVIEEGKPRFFRRRGKGDFDLEDLQFRVGQLTSFVLQACHHYEIFPPIAIGHSNGANLVWATMFGGRSALSGAILFRPMLAFDPGRPAVDLHGFPVLIIAGRNDSVVPVSRANELPDLYRAAGASVSIELTDATHDLSDEDSTLSSNWIRGNFPQGSPDFHERLSFHHLKIKTENGKTEGKKK